MAKNISTKLSASDRGRNFMMDMGRGTGRQTNKKHENSKKKCRKKVNIYNYQKKNQIGKLSGFIASLTIFNSCCIRQSRNQQCSLVQYSLQ